MPRLYRVENNNLLQEKNLNIKTCKKNTIKSLNEVETFLRNFGQFTKYIKLYKILK